MWAYTACGHDKNRRNYSAPRTRLNSTAIEFGGNSYTNSMRRNVPCRLLCQIWDLHNLLLTDKNEAIDCHRKLAKITVQYHMHYCWKAKGPILALTLYSSKIRYRLASSKHVRIVYMLFIFYNCLKVRHNISAKSASAVVFSIMIKLSIFWKSWFFGLTRNPNIRHFHRSVFIESGIRNSCSLLSSPQRADKVQSN